VGEIVFSILDISIRSKDIRTQSGKESEIRPKLACFSPPIFWGDRPPNFWTNVIKQNMLPKMTQNFAAICQGTTEITR